MAKKEKELFENEAVEEVKPIEEPVKEEQTAKKLFSSPKKKESGCRLS